ncbi:MAG TPA: acetyl-CoA acetyltransferase [Ktedonobacteraceae bacterium]|nr:acetyl-CoA acetyltransferase [Ktedonobacteraceae bacterium]
MPSYKGRIVIAGVAESDYGRVPHLTELELHAQALQRVLEESGARKQDIDGVFCSSHMMGMPTVMLCEYLQMFPRYSDSTTIGGSSFEAHLNHAVAAMRAGKCEMALISYGSTQLSSRGRVLGTGGRPATIPESTYESPYGNVLVGAYAMAARRHMHQFGTTSEQLAEIAVVTRRHAGLNPLAMYREPITVQDVLNSRMIADPLHLLDCCVVSDGGGTVLVTTEERARDLRQLPIYVLGSSEGHTHAHISQMPDLTVTPAAMTGPRAFAEAGVSPEDIDMAMIYDSFTITVLLLLEDLGFCKKGEGGAFVQGGRIALGGQLPINTDGGGLSSNHPGMRGIFLIIEAVRQLRGQCGARQVEGAKLAVAHGSGGLLSSQATTILSSI